MKNYMLFTMAVLAMAVTFAFGLEIGIEAEDGVIEAPMVIGVPADAAAQGGPEPVDPSGGKFVWVPGPPTTGGGGEGFVRFEVNIPTAGTYAIWGRIVAWDGNSDSLWVTVVPPDPADENPQQSQDTHYRWSTQQGNEWHWDKVNQWLDGGTFERQWDIPAGKVTITMWCREDATMLDCIYITDNLDDDVAVVAPKLPSEITPEPSAVNGRDKLPTVWASLK